MYPLFETSGKTKNLVILSLLFGWFNLMLSQFLSKDHALDLKFAYSVEEAYLAIGQLNLDQRLLYRFGIWALDMPYMLVYGLLLGGILYRIWGKGKILWLPYLISASDFLENLWILRILKLFPQENEVLAILASIFTTAKWVFVLIAFGGIIYGILRWVSSRKSDSYEPEEIKI